MRLPAFVVFVWVMLVALGGCTSRGPAQSGSGPAGSAAPTAEPTALPPVDAAPQAALPAWIVSISPRGQAADGSQIRVRFANDVVPVEALESPDRQSALAHFTLEPALPGRFVFLTPRMVGFEADAPVPHAARVRVILTAGLADLSGHHLNTDFVWSFTTQPLTLTTVPGSDPSSTPAPQNRTPRIGIDASDPLDAQSLADHAKLIDATDSSKTIALQIAPSPSPDPSASAAATSDASGADNGSSGAHYDLVPAEQLAYDRTYHLQIGAGVLPAAGNVGTASAYSGAVRTYGPLKFTSLVEGSSDRFAGNFPSLGFSNPIDPATVAHAIAISPSPAPGIPLVRANDDGSVDLNPDAFEPNVAYAVTIAPTIADTFGQTLGSAATTGFKTGSLAANLAAPTGYRIFPSGIDLALNVQSVNLPDRAYRSAYRVLKPQDLVGFDPGNGDASTFLPDSSTWKATPVKQTPNVENDAALPLRTALGGATGTLAYGFTARTTQTTDSNGKVTWNEPNFNGTVQVTNLGVFTQWFPDGGLVRVHHLGDGSVAPNARVEIYESFVGSDTKAPANEAPCATGTTGADGTWHPSSAAWAACAGTATSADQAPALLTIATRERTGRTHGIARMRTATTWASAAKAGRPERRTRAAR
jgi:hypothetical protein